MNLSLSPEDVDDLQRAYDKLKIDYHLLEGQFTTEKNHNDKLHRDYQKLWEAYGELAHIYGKLVTEESQREAELAELTKRLSDLRISFQKLKNEHSYCQETS